LPAKERQEAERLLDEWVRVRVRLTGLRVGKTGAARPFLVLARWRCGSWEKVGSLDLTLYLT
jgi:hypothetical protein